MRKKVLNLSLVLASLVGYLEWGKDQSVFLFQAEAELFSKALGDPAAVIHPFTILPVAGQAVLVWTLFQKDVGKRLTYLGIAGVGTLLGLMFVIGLIGRNMRVFSSTLPFLVIAFLTWREHRVSPRPGSQP